MAVIIAAIFNFVGANERNRGRQNDCFRFYESRNCHSDGRACSAHWREHVEFDDLVVSNPFELFSRPHRRLSGAVVAQAGFGAFI